MRLLDRVEVHVVGRPLRNIRPNERDNDRLPRAADGGYGALHLLCRLAGIRPDQQDAWEGVAAAFDLLVQPLLGDPNQLGYQPWLGDALPVREQWQHVAHCESERDFPW